MVAVQKIIPFPLFARFPGYEAKAGTQSSHGFLLPSESIMLANAMTNKEWLQRDPRRTSVGLDLVLEALQWCLENNVHKVGADGYSKISLFHGNVLNPQEVRLVGFKPQELIKNIKPVESDYNSEIAATEVNMLEGSTSTIEQSVKADAKIPARDIICAFSYNCCRLHKRAKLVLYSSMFLKLV
ncbi:hypothetical protein V6N11_039864 [Hibiscus sabdariffa]|uniref:Uncharacterized protein n=1 Tax=Hibiscus sabdariffa TaxID=183260 RepID=A0ABR2RGE8_9ROSI